MNRKKEEKILRFKFVGQTKENYLGRVEFELYATTWGDAIRQAQDKTGIVFERFNLVEVREPL